MLSVNFSVKYDAVKCCQFNTTNFIVKRNRRNFTLFNCQKRRRRRSPVKKCVEEIFQLKSCLFCELFIKEVSKSAGEVVR